MQLRKVALIGIFAAVALLSGLIGFWFGSSQVPVATSIGQSTEVLQSEPIQGTMVAATQRSQVRLYAGPSPKSPIAYTIQGNKVWVGPSTSGTSVYTLQGDRLLHSLSSEIQYIRSGNRIYRGGNANSEAVYTITDHRVFPGASATGKPLLTFVGNHVHWGDGATGRMIMTANTDIEGNPTLEFLLPILLLERF